MNIKEFVEKKYRRENVHAITTLEARTFGIANDLSTGWIKRHGNKEVTKDMALLLLKRIYENPRHNDRKSIKVLIDNYQNCANYAKNYVFAVDINKKSKKVINKKVKKLNPIYPVYVKKYNTKELKNIFEYANSPDFLQSYEWRKLRLEALKMYGAKCQCCGASPDTGAVMNVDHIKPRKLFPELCLDINNLQVLCHECNHGKGNWDQTDWRKTEHKTYDPALEFNDRFTK